MGKGNLFLGFGRGKIGDVVYFRQYGEQVWRARNKSPKNPQTSLQLLQRVILKTVSSAYSLLQPLANHSFQGAQEGTANQSMFTKRNVEILRNRLASIINDGDPSDILSSTEANFSRKASNGAEINAYLISEGKMTEQQVSFNSGVASLLLGEFGTAPTYSNLTYQQVVDALGLQRGDQVTFVWLGCDDSGNETEGTFRSFDFARVILEPASGDMSTLFSTQAGAVNSPNVRNEGSVVLGVSGTGPYYLTFSSTKVPSAAGRTNSLCAATVIASRLNGGVWERSTQQLVLRPAGTGASGALTYDNNLDLLGDAVLSFMSQAQSSLYLNQSRSFKPAGATAGEKWLEDLPDFVPNETTGLGVFTGEVRGFRNFAFNVSSQKKIDMYKRTNDDGVWYFNTQLNQFVAADVELDGLVQDLIDAAGLVGYEVASSPFVNQTSLLPKNEVTFKVSG